MIKLCKAKHIALLLMIILLAGIIMLSSGCDPFAGVRPINFPNTRWVSNEPDIFFEVDGIGRITYAQMTVDGEIIEMDVFMRAGDGSIVSFILPPTSENRYNHSERMLFIGAARFGEHRMILRIINNYQDLLDDSISEIIFVREDIDTPRYISGHPPEGIWISDELGITVDFYNRFFDEDELVEYFKGTVIIDGEIIEIVCKTNIHGSEAIFSVAEERLHRGFFRLRYDDESVVTFVLSGVRYTFVRQEAQDEKE